MQADKGEFGYKFRGDVRDSERKWELEKKAFGLDVAELGVEARDKAARRKLSKRGQNVTLKGQGVTRRGQDISDRRSGRGQDITLRGQDITKRGQDLTDRRSRGGKPVSREERIRNRENWRKAVNSAKTVAPGGKWGKDDKGKRWTYQRYYSGLANKVGPVMAKAAIEIALRGGVSPKLSRRIRKEYPGARPGVRKQVNRRAKRPVGDVGRGVEKILG